MRPVALMPAAQPNPQSRHSAPRELAMKVVKAAAVQTSPALYSREG